MEDEFQIVLRQRFDCQANVTLIERIFWDATKETFFIDVRQTLGCQEKELFQIIEKGISQWKDKYDKKNKN